MDETTDALPTRLARAVAVIGACAALAAVGPLGCDGPPVTDAGPLEARPGPRDPAAALDPVADACAWLCGHYSSAAQAAADPAFFDVRLHIVRIWPDRLDGPWLYVEQAMATAQDKPYRQRVYRLAALPGGGAESSIFELPGNPLDWAGAWKDVSRFNALDPALLSVRPGCAVVLAYSGPGRMTGSTQGDACGSALRGAAYATSEVTLTAGELDSWDRGFDSKGNQVWGSTKGAYRFVKEAPAPARRPDPEMPLGTEASVAPGDTTAVHPPMPSPGAGGTP
jgi:hypothetical protein